jgi:hypothetical protein
VATATPIQHQQNRHRAHPNPKSPHSILCLWHLLSLDAPTVAVLWTWFIATATHLRLPFAATLSMAIAVWMLYAADRLMDARLVDARPLDSPFTQPNDLEARHHFHHRHRALFLTGILLASITLAILLPRLAAPAIHLYLILGGLLSGYFILIHATPRAEASRKIAHRLPKEIAVGIFFAAATFIPTVARRPDLRLALLPAALLFAGLCSLNCLFIYAWEHATPHPGRPAHAATRFALRHLQAISILLSVASTALALFDRHAPWPIFSATAAAAAALLILHHRRHTLAATTLRAAADLVLLTPLLLLTFLK